MRRFALFAVLSFGLAACTTSGGDPIDGAWEMESGIFDGQPVPIVATHPITITLDDGNVGGSAACNGYGGRYSQSGDTIDFTEFAMTEMACFPEGVMVSEQTYVTALANVESAAIIEGGKLQLSGSRTALVYTELVPVAASDLLGTVWVLDGLVQGETVSSVSGERATLEMFSDGSFIGSTGCRTITGEYVVSGAEVVFTSWGAHGECPTDLAGQDSNVISALEGGFRIEIDGDVLTTWVAGDEGLIYKSEP